MKQEEFKISIDAPPQKIWQLLWGADTYPVWTSVFSEGSRAETDWQKGSSITYTGEWEGKSYEDKGVIIDIVPEKLLHTTYFSAMSGKEDKPENYANVIYKVSPDDGHSLVTITQDNIDDEKQLQHMEENWGKVLDSMKKLLES